MYSAAAMRFGLAAAEDSGREAYIRPRLGGEKKKKKREQKFTLNEEAVVCQLISHQIKT